MRKIITIIITTTALFLSLMMIMMMITTSRSSFFVRSAIVDFPFACSNNPFTGDYTGDDITFTNSINCDFVIKDVVAKKITFNNIDSTGSVTIENVECRDSHECIKFAGDPTEVQPKYLNIKNVSLTGSVAALVVISNYASVVNFAQTLSSVSEFIFIENVTSDFELNRDSGTTTTLYGVRFNQLLSTRKVNISNIRIQNKINGDGTMLVAAVEFTVIQTSDQLEIDVSNIFVQDLSVTSQSTSNSVSFYGVRFNNVLLYDNFKFIKVSNINVIQSSFSTPSANPVPGISVYGVYFKERVTNVHDGIYIEGIDFDNVTFRCGGIIRFRVIYFLEDLADIQSFSAGGVTLNDLVLNSKSNSVDGVGIYFNDQVSSFNSPQGFLIENFTSTNVEITGSSSVGYKDFFINNFVQTLYFIKINNIRHERCTFKASSSGNVDVTGVYFSKKIQSIDQIDDPVTISNISFANCTFDAPASVTHTLVTLAGGLHEIKNFIMSECSTNRMLYLVKSGSIQARGITMGHARECGASSGNRQFSTGVTISNVNLFYNNSFAYSQSTNVVIYIVAVTDSSDNGDDLQSQNFQIQHCSIGTSSAIAEGVDEIPVLPFADVFSEADAVTGTNPILLDYSYLNPFFVGDVPEEPAVLNELATRDGGVEVSIIHSTLKWKDLRGWFLVQNSSIGQLHSRSVDQYARTLAVYFVGHDLIDFGRGFMVSRVNIFNTIYSAGTYVQTLTVVIMQNIEGFGRMISSNAQYHPISDELNRTADGNLPFYSFEVLNCQTHNINATSGTISLADIVHLPDSDYAFNNNVGIQVMGNNISTVSMNSTTTNVAVDILYNVRAINNSGPVIIRENSVELINSNASAIRVHIMRTFTTISNLSAIYVENNIVKASNVRQDTGTNPTTQNANFIVWYVENTIEDVRRFEFERNQIQLSGLIWVKNTAIIYNFYSTSSIKRVQERFIFRSNVITISETGTKVVNENDLIMLAVIVPSTIQDIDSTPVEFNFNQINIYDDAEVQSAKAINIAVVLIMTLKNLQQVIFKANRINLYSTGKMSTSIQEKANRIATVLQAAGSTDYEIADVDEFKIDRGIILFRNGFNIQAENRILISIFLQYAPVTRVNKLEIVDCSITGQAIPLSEFVSAHENVNVSIATFSRQAPLLDVKQLIVENSQMRNLKLVSDEAVASSRIVTFFSSFSNSNNSNTDDTMIKIANSDMNGVKLIANLGAFLDVLSFTGGDDEVLANVSSIVVTDSTLSNFDVQSADNDEDEIVDVYSLFSFNIRVANISEMIFNNTITKDSFELLMYRKFNFFALFFYNTQTENSIKNVASIQMHNSYIFLSNIVNQATLAGNDAAVRLVHFDTALEVSSSSSLTNNNNNNNSGILITNSSIVIDEFTFHNDLRGSILSLNEGIEPSSSSSSDSSLVSSSSSNIIVKDCTFSFNNAIVLPDGKTFEVSAVVLKKTLAGMANGSLIFDGLNINLTDINTASAVHLRTLEVTPTVAQTAETEIEEFSVKNCNILVARDSKKEYKSTLFFNHLHCGPDWTLAHIRNIQFSDNTIDLENMSEIKHDATAASGSAYLRAVSVFVLSTSIHNISGEISIKNTRILLPPLLDVRSHAVIGIFTCGKQSGDVNSFIADANTVQLPSTTFASTSGIFLYLIAFNDIVSQIKSIVISHQVITQRPGDTKAALTSPTDCNVSIVSIYGSVESVDYFSINGSRISNVQTTAYSKSSSVFIVSFMKSVTNFLSIVVQNSELSNIQIQGQENANAGIAFFTGAITNITDNISIVSCYMQSLGRIQMQTTTNAFKMYLYHTNFFYSTLQNIGKIHIQDASLLPANTRGFSAVDATFMGYDTMQLGILNLGGGSSSNNIGSIEVSDVDFSGHIQSRSTFTGNILCYIVFIKSLALSNSIRIVNVSGRQLHFDRQSTSLTAKIDVSAVHFDSVNAVDSLTITDVALEITKSTSARSDDVNRISAAGFFHGLSENLTAQNYTVERVNVNVRESNSNTGEFFGVRIHSVLKIHSLAIRQTTIVVSETQVFGSNDAACVGVFLGADHIDESVEVEDVMVKSHSFTPLDLSPTTPVTLYHVALRFPGLLGTGMNITNIRIRNMFVEVSELAVGSHDLRIFGLYLTSSISDTSLPFKIRGVFEVTNTTINIIPDTTISATYGDGDSDGKVIMNGVLIDSHVESDDGSMLLLQKQIVISDVKIVTRTPPFTPSIYGATILADSSVNISLVLFEKEIRNFDSSLSTFNINKLHFNGSLPNAKIQIQVNNGSTHLSAVNFNSHVYNISSYSMLIASGPSSSTTKTDQKLIIEDISMKNIGIVHHKSTSSGQNSATIIAVHFQGEVSTSLKDPSSWSSPDALVTELSRGIFISNVTFVDFFVSQSGSQLHFHVLHFADLVSNIDSLELDGVNTQNTQFLGGKGDPYYFSIFGSAEGINGQRTDDSVTRSLDKRMSRLSFTNSEINITTSGTLMNPRMTDLYDVLNVGRDRTDVDGGIFYQNVQLNLWSHAMSASGRLRYIGTIIGIYGRFTNITNFKITSSSINYGHDYIDFTNVSTSSAALSNFATDAPFLVVYFVYALSMKDVGPVHIHSASIEGTSTLQAYYHFQLRTVFSPSMVMTSFKSALTDQSPFKIESCSINVTKGYELFALPVFSSGNLFTILSLRRFSDVEGSFEMNHNTIAVASASSPLDTILATAYFTNAVARVERIIFDGNQIEIPAQKGLTTAQTLTFASSNTEIRDLSGRKDELFVVAGIFSKGGSISEVETFTVSNCKVKIYGTVNASEKIYIYIAYLTQMAQDVNFFTFSGNQILVAANTGKLISSASSPSDAGVLLFISRFDDDSPQNTQRMTWNYGNEIIVEDGALIQANQGLIHASITRFRDPPVVADSLEFSNINKISLSSNTISPSCSLFRSFIYDIKNIAYNPGRVFASSSVQIADSSVRVGDTAFVQEHTTVDIGIASAPVSFPNQTRIITSTVELTLNNNTNTTAGEEISPSTNDNNNNISVMILKTTFLSAQEPTSISDYQISNPVTGYSNFINIKQCSVKVLTTTGFSDDQYDTRIKNTTSSIIQIESGSYQNRGVPNANIKSNLIDSCLEQSSILYFQTGETRTNTLQWMFINNSITSSSSSSSSLFSTSSTDRPSSAALMISANHSSSFARDLTDSTRKAQFYLEDNYIDAASFASSKIGTFSQDDDLSMLDIEVHCNRWTRAVDRLFQEHVSTTTISKLNFSCPMTKTLSKTRSKTVMSVTKSKSIDLPTTTSSTTTTTTLTNTSTTTTLTNTSTTTTVTNTTQTATTATNATTETSITPLATLSTTTTTSAPPTPKTKTKTRSVSILPPTPPPPPGEPHVKIPPATTGLTTTVVVVNTIVANPALGPLAVRNGLILLGGSCGEAIGELDFATSPLGLEFGKDEYRFWNGAVIGNFAVVLATFPVLFLPTMIFAIYVKKKPWDEYWNGVRAISGTFWIVLSGPIIVGFIASYGYSREGVETLGVLLVGIVTCGVTILWPLYIIRCVKKEMHVGDFTDGEGNGVTNAEKKASILSRVKAYLFDSRTGQEWIPFMHELRLGWAFLFEYSGSLLYLIIEVICGFGINVTLGLMQDSGASESACRFRALANLFLHLPPTLFLIFMNPLLSRFDLVVTTAMWIGNTFTSIMLTMKIFKVGLPIDETLYAFGLVLAVLNLFASLGLVFDTWQMIRLLSARGKASEILSTTSTDKNNQSSSSNNNNNPTNLNDLEENLLMEEELTAFFNNNDNSGTNSSSEDPEGGIMMSSSSTSANKKVKSSTTAISVPSANTDDSTNDDHHQSSPFSPRYDPLTNNLDDEEEINLDDVLDGIEKNKQSSDESKNKKDDDDDEDEIDLEAVLGTFGEEYPELESALTAKDVE